MHLVTLILLILPWLAPRQAAGYIQHWDANNKPVLTLTRGLDLSGSFQGAGGIGGLLALTQPTASGLKHLYYSSDGGGNVTALVNSNQMIVAQYLYDPFGNTLSLRGPAAEVNPYRFSSKPAHAISGNYDFLYRWYSPDLQRWLNRDPIGETGGLNLYGFVHNSPFSAVDAVGLNDAPRWAEYMANNPPDAETRKAMLVSGAVVIPASLALFFAPEVLAFGLLHPVEVTIGAETVVYTAAQYPGPSLIPGPPAAPATQATKTAVTQVAKPAASQTRAAAVPCLTAKGLTQSEASALRKINNILSKNLKPGPKGDISGAIHDMVGNPIPKPGGGTYDHIEDLGSMLRGLRTNAEKLAISVDPAAVVARQQAEAAIKKIEEAIKGAGL